MKSFLDHITEISFEEILPIWSQLLWPSRKSLIEETSVIKLGGGYEMDYLQHPATFFGYKKGACLAGVVSCFPTAKNEFRLRGLFVRPEHRGQGLAKALVQKTALFSLHQGGQKMWSLPRVENKPVYAKLGFSSFLNITHQFEFGPHYYAVMDLASQSQLGLNTRFKINDPVAFGG